MSKKPSAAKPALRKRYPSGEYALLEKMRPYCRTDLAAPYEITLGDDAAVRRARSERIILTADISVEDVHFSLKSMTLAEAGYRAMVSNISDCAAMGAVPDSALVQLVFPAGTPNLDKKVEEIYKGFSEALMRWKFPIVGGDLSGGTAWTIAITLVGQVPSGRRAMLRTGIKDGDVLWCTGYPGRSAAGFNAMGRFGRAKVPKEFRDLLECHIRPCPRVDEGMRLAKSHQVHAMMDLSDGLSKDAATLCFENNLGLILDPGSSQPPCAMVQLSSRLGVPWTEWFFHGGEDYELLFAAAPRFDPERGPRGKKNSFVKLGVFSSSIKKCVWRDTGGKLRTAEHRSYDHVKRTLH